MAAVQSASEVDVGQDTAEVHRARYRLHRDAGRWQEALRHHEALLVCREAELARLEALAIRDGLTGLFSRRQFDARLTEECQRAKRYGRPLSLLLLDVDRFKDINDRLGHIVGDRVLQTVAGIIQENTRTVDLPARYGGDEVAVLLPDTDRSGAREAAEKLRSLIAATDWSDIVDGLSVTISVGVAGYVDGGVLLEAADRALYVAKRAGRDQISG
ncbi:MAG: diguanylate cyclase (GGDEF)-like protein [Myxococcota bacterium]|jgi:diguanylate cyclase (GGDEF)-like protein